MKLRIPSIFFTILALTIFAVLVFSFYVTRSMPIPEASRSFTITSGESVKTITRNLITGGVEIRDFWFRTYVWLTRKERSFIAGSFELPPEASIEELAQLFTTKGMRKIRTITIPEGW